MDENTREEESPMQSSPDKEEQRPETAVPEGFPAPGPAITSGEEETSDEREQTEEQRPSQVETEEDVSMQLGDHYELEMASGKKVSGIIYFIDTEKLIRILPDGVNHELEDFPLIEMRDPDSGEPYYDFDPELQLTDIILTQKTSVSSFVDLIGLRVGQKLTTFKQDRSIGSTLEVTAVNSERDSIRVVEEGDTNEREIDFNHKGIPLEEDFVILQIKPDEKPQEDQLEVEPEQPAPPLEGDELEIDVLGEIALPSRIEVQEIAATERIYDERQQKNSFIEDLRTMLDVTAQNNPTVLKNIRVMTEVFSDLKNSVIERDEAGYPRGEKQISLQTMNDLITVVDAPIAKPVLDTRRVLVSEESANVQNPQLDMHTLGVLVENSTQYLQTMGGIEADTNGEGVPRWYLVWSSYFKRFPMGDLYQGTGYSMQKDTEYFRHDAPGAETTVEGLKTIQGKTFMGKAQGESKLYGSGEVSGFIKGLPFSYRRGHGHTLRGLPKGGTEVAIVGDKARKVGTVLFPFEIVLGGGMGAIRIGNLWEVLKRGFAEKVWMDVLLKLYNLPIKELNTRKIIHIQNTNTDVIQTQFVEYLRKVFEHISIEGRGDLYKINQDLGMQDMELTTEQASIVEEKVKSTIAGLRQYLTELRNELAKPAEKPKVAPFLNVQILEALSKVMQREPLLEELVQEMNSKIPNYKDIDIAIFSYLLLHAQDYILAALTGNESHTSRERLRFERAKLIGATVANRKARELQESKGHTPEINPCRHVKDLNKIRKIKSETERMAILTQFLVQYDGGMDGNWVKCQRCKKHLLCKHEVLQIQQFLHPKEHQILQKQLVLGFAGGRQGSKYICRNCGQPFADIEFDTSLEYNDEGVPMMGRKVIVDKDALEKERIQNLLGIRVDTDEKMKFKNETQKELYTLLREIITRIGVEIDRSAISRILDMAELEVLRLLSEKEYTAVKRKLKYIEYKTRSSIVIVATLLLLEIQTHIPNYQVRFAVEGCKPGFGGYPLVESADPENEDQSVGIQYMTCILNQIYKNETPWSNGFQKISKDEERHKNIKSNLKNSCIYFAEKNNTIQTMLAEKREFERNVYGAAAAKGRPNEHIPSGFLPRQETRQEAAENAAQAPAVPEGAARTNLGNLVLADTWIRAANKVVREKGAPVIMKDSPFVETTCCLNPIKEPQHFWSTVALPTPPPLTTTPNPFSHKSIAYTAFVPRPFQVLQETPPDASAYYKVVLKLCYKGDHLGQPHEFGADYKCDWCDLKIPIELQNPDVDKNGLSIISWEKVKGELDRQGVQVSEQVFQQILDKSHQLNTFSPYIRPDSMTGLQICNYLRAITPPPVPDFANSMKDTMQKLTQLPATASKTEIIQAMNTLIRGPMKDGEERGKYQQQEDDLKGVVGDKNFGYLQSLLNENPESIFNVVLSYFVVPAERLVKGRTEIAEYLEGIKQYNLGESHISVIKTILTNHIQPLLNLERDVYGIHKLKNYVEMMSKVFAISQELRVSRIRFYKNTSPEALNLFLNRVIRIFVISALANLIDPGTKAVDENNNEIAGGPGNSETFLHAFVSETIQMYTREHLVYNPNYVKQKIEEANEMEHQRFIDYLDKLTPEQRKVEMTKKRLGIGMWAIGGTKAVYQYDPDQWERNREAVASSYANAAAYDPNAELPAAMQMMNTTGYDMQAGADAQEYGYEYSFVGDDD